MRGGTFAAQKRAYEQLDEFTKVKVEGSNVRMTIANVTPAVAIGSCKETTRVCCLTFQPVIVRPADAAIVQHVTESAIVVSITGQCGGDLQSVGHGVLPRCV